MCVSLCTATYRTHTAVHVTLQCIVVNQHYVGANPHCIPASVLNDHGLLCEQCTSLLTQYSFRSTLCCHESTLHTCCGSQCSWAVGRGPSCIGMAERRRYVCTACGYMARDIGNVHKHQQTASRRLGHYIHNRHLDTIVHVNHRSKLCKWASIVKVTLGIRPRAVDVVLADEDGDLHSDGGDRASSPHSDREPMSSPNVHGMQHELHAAWGAQTGMSIAQLPTGVPQGGFVRAEHDEEIIRASGRQFEDRHDDASPRLTWTDKQIYHFIMTSGLTVAQGSELLKLLTDHRFDAEDISYVAVESYHRAMAMQSAGLRSHEVTQPGVHGCRPAVFWYRCAWDIVKEWLQDPAILPRMTLEYTPASDNAGDRMFGGFGSSPWLQNAYARMEDPTVTVVAIVVGSDEFANQNKEAWPMYISCPNFTTEMIQSQRYWKVAGFFPKLEDSGLSNFDRKRRLRLAHDRCRCAVLHAVIEIGKAGGQHVLCADSQWRKICPLLMLYVGDRPEHELVLGSHAQTCLLCKSTTAQYGDAVPSDVGGYAPGEITEIREKAMTTGVYGEHDEWTELLVSGQPIEIARRNGQTGELDVVSMERYKHCTRVTKVIPDTNQLMSQLQQVGIQLNECCMPDPLHTVLLGLMKHLLKATIATIVDVLRPEWAFGSGAECTNAKLGAICNNIDRRVATMLPHGPKRVKEALGVALENFQSGRQKNFQFETTAKEMEQLFEVFPHCLQDLITTELDDLNQVAALQGQAAVGDPMPRIAECLAMFQVRCVHEHTRACSVLRPFAVPNTIHVVCMYDTVPRAACTNALHGRCSASMSHCIVP